MCAHGIDKQAAAIEADVVHGENGTRMVSQQGTYVVGKAATIGTDAQFARP